jgi:hypothetical protein
MNKKSRNIFICLLVLIVISLAGITIMVIRNHHTKLSTTTKVNTVITPPTTSHVAENPENVQKDISDKKEVSTDYNLKTGSFSQFKEINISSSPDTEISIGCKNEIIDFCILPDNSNVAIISGEERHPLYLWNYRTLEETLINYPDNFIPVEIVSHPQDKIVYVLGKDTDSSNNITGYKIIKYDIDQKKMVEIYNDKYPLSDLITSHAKFDNYKQTYFRLFFARIKDNITEVVTISENGENFYPVISNDTAFSSDWLKFPELGPNIHKSSYGVPVTFHPAGSVFYWRKEDGIISAIPYVDDNWGEGYIPDFISKFQVDKPQNIEFSPNGMYMVFWKPGEENLSVLNMFTEKETEIKLGFGVHSKIRFTSDGRGIVLIKDGKEILYKPLDLPLYNVENAWMYYTDKDDMKKFYEYGGLFRKTEYNQMYNVYESENYQCDGYDTKTATRPYLVTTDPFHEILEAAYGGLFYVNERDYAIALFNNFLKESDKAYKENSDEISKKWAMLFSNCLKILDGIYDNDELLRVRDATGTYESDVLNLSNVDYSQFKPRGYYEQSGEMFRYFQAVQYISMAKPTKEQWQEFLKNKSVVSMLKKWIDSYSPFIPQSKRALPGYEQEYPKYLKHKPEEDERYTLFPKAWGIDNEIMDSVVYHSTWPEEDRITGINGEFKLFPDINELAYIFGNSYSKKILEQEGLFKEYPILENIHKDLITRWQEFMNGNISGVYNNWLLLISKQVSGVKPDWPWLTDGLWSAKQIQTGLASWTNLRHATVLVNETVAAECGEGGFEFIFIKPPRGAVEPHPEAFAGLITVFEELKRVFLDIQGYMKDDNTGSNESFKTGIVARLDNVINNLKTFKAIAEKEIKNEPLTDEDYQNILICGRAMEHDFLVFKGILAKNYGLANPDPLSKIVDIYGDNRTGVLHSAIGRPFEWDLIVPYYGRRQIVKGCVYSLYSFIEPNPVSDTDWRSEIDKHELPDWIKMYVTEKKLSCPAKISFTR